MEKKVLRVYTGPVSGLRCPDRLDDLEYGRSADDEHEERQQPGTHGRLVLLAFLEY